MTPDEAIDALRFDLESYLAGADGREHEAVSTLIEAVERVRELCRDYMLDAQRYAISPVVAVEEVLAALDGPS